MPDLDREYLEDRINATETPGERLKKEFLSRQTEETFAEPEAPQQAIPRAISEVKEPDAKGKRGAAIDVPLQAVGGVRDAVQEAMDGFTALQDFYNSKYPELEEMVIMKKPFQFPLVPEPDTVSGSLTRGVTQFLTGFVPVASALKIGKGVKMVQAAKTVAASAITDFSIFDPHAERLSNFLSEFPFLRNPVTKYLAADSTDAELEGRLKNVMEGLGMDALATGAFVGALKFIRAGKKAKESRSLIRKQAKNMEGKEPTKTPDTPEAKAKDEELKQAFSEVNQKPIDIYGSKVAALTRKLERIEDKLPEDAPLLIQLATPGKTALNINLAKIEDDSDIKKIYTATAELFEDRFTKVKRGTISDERMRELAEESGLNVDDLLARKKGELFKPEEILASRELLVSSAKNLKKLGEKLNSPLTTDADRLIFKRAMTIHAAIQEQVSGLTAEAGRALRVFREIAESRDEQVEMINQLLMASGGRENIDAMAKAISELSSTAEINRFAKKAFQATTMDMVLEAWKGSILSGPRTHIVNVVSSLLNILTVVGERFLASGVSTLRGKRTTAASESMHMVFGILQGVQDGWKLAARTFKDEGSIDFFTKTERMDRRAITARQISNLWFGKMANKVLKGMGAKTLEQGGLVARFADFMGMTARLSFRFLGAEDAFFKSVFHSMELHAQAYRQAASEGLNGKALAERIAHYVQNPKLSMRDISRRMAEKNTYTNPNEFTKNFAFVREPGYKWVQFILPFINAPSNIIAFGFERSPFAVLSKSIRQEILKGGPEGDLALARIAVGSMAMLQAWRMAKEGKITGGPPVDKDMKRLWLQRNQPYSFVVEQKDGSRMFIGFNRLEPIGMLMGSAADLAIIHDALGNKDAAEIVTAGVMAMARNITSKTWLQAVSNLIEAFDDPDKEGSKFITNISSGFVPNLVNQINQSYIDPLLRESGGFKEGDFWAQSLAVLIDDAKKRIPGYSQDLPPVRNLWGEPIEPREGMNEGFVNQTINMLSPLYFKKVGPDPVTDWMIENEVEVEMPKKKIEIQGFEEAVPLKGKEYSRFVELAGKTAKKELDNSFYSKLKDSGNDEKAQAVKRIISAYRIQAKQQLLQEYPEILERARSRAAVLLSRKTG